MRPVDSSERLWDSDNQAPNGRNIDELDSWLKQRNQRSIVRLGTSLDGMHEDSELVNDVKSRIDRIRRVKDGFELETLQSAIEATTAGFAQARKSIYPGTTERAIQIELEAEMFRHGANNVGYRTVVASGRRAAILHAKPSQKTIDDGDVVLVDAGGSVEGYTADVTRTFAASGRFSVEQQAVYDLVLSAQKTAIDRCRDGVEWRDVHLAAATAIATGLSDIGLLESGVEESLETGAVSLFFPHGIGHMLGLGVRDVGGIADDREERLCCGVRLRVDLPLRAGFVMTVEPGIYFVPAILDDSVQRERFRKAVAWEKLDRWRAVGGVRIEDNVLITTTSPKVLTAAISQ